MRGLRACKACALPPGALLRRYAIEGYADGYAIDVPGRVTHAAYVEAFYTTAVFKLERWLLGVFVSKPSTDAQAAALARGQAEAFSAWTVEARAPDQLLMCDLGARTRSWLMVEPSASGGTRLFFGSAVVALPGRDEAGRPRMGTAFHALLGFHELYSRVLLAAAVRRLGGVARQAATSQTNA